jgi:rod shape determining protein RodA
MSFDEIYRIFSWSDFSSAHLSIRDRILRLNFTIITIITILAGVGVMMLYSAGNGSMEPWAGRHLAKFILGFAVMITIAMIDIRRFLQYSYVIYFLCILLLIAVQLKGTSGKGAQRWIDLGVVQLQPSELMKIGLILALARFYHSTAIERLQEWRALLMPGFLTLLPVGLVLAQPNLGTATIMVLTAAALTLMSGLRARILIICLVLGVSAMPSPSTRWSTCEG